MGKRVFVDDFGRIWVEDKAEGGMSHLSDPYEVEKDRQIPTNLLEKMYKFAWNTDEDWVKNS